MPILISVPSLRRTSVAPAESCQISDSTEIHDLPTLYNRPCYSTIYYFNGPKIESKSVTNVVLQEQ